MTSLNKAIAEEYASNPLQTHQQIADKMNCQRKTVSVALHNPKVKAYIDELMKEYFAEAKNKALKNMSRMAEQDNNLMIKFRACEFILKANGIGNEQKVDISSDTGIEINITNDNK